MTKLQMRNLSFLFLTAMIWGAAFVAQSVAVSYMAPNTFTCIRSLIASLALLPVIFLFDRRKKGDTDSKIRKKSGKSVYIGGALCGIFLFGGSIFQQMGIQHTSPGKAGFITALYIVGVPLIGIFLKKKTGPFLWIGVVLAVAGLYFLCMTENLSVGKGDGWLLLCALIFSCHILVVDHFIAFTDGLKMSCVQLFVCGLCALFFMLALESPDPARILQGWKPLLYAAVMSSGVGYTLQLLGQQDVNPTAASLILSMESVFAALSGALFLGQILSPRETLGCGLMFAAIILAQIPQKK